MIAKIVPLVRLPKNLILFDYSIPSNLEGTIKLGQLVEVPFRKKNINGIIFKLEKETSQNLQSKLKPIGKIWDKKPTLTKEQLELLEWISSYYISPLPLVAKTFLPPPPLKKHTLKEKLSKGIPSTISSRDIGEIKNVLQKYNKNKKDSFLLHYENEKNKIAVYSKIIEDALNKDKQILILVPQISNVNNLAPYLEHLFSNKIAVLHGNLSKTEYWKNWQRAKNNKAKIIIGTRSAIFSPSEKLGLVIIDTEDSVDFKQSDQNPRYDARKAMEKLKELTNIKLILASQAPKIESYYKVNQDSATLLEEKSFPPFNFFPLIDLNNDIKDKNFSPISKKLEQHIRENLEDNKKIILLANRRGAANMLLCKDCDHIFRCKNCNKVLTYHEDYEDKNQLVCHSCNYRENIPLGCVKCKGTSLKFVGKGTQGIEKEIRKKFAQQSISRIDSDSSGNINLKANIYIGTEFFVKNFLDNIDNIGVIGIISLDNLLFLPDFKIAEKIFSQIIKTINISQKKKAQFFLQTLYPENDIINLAIEKKYNRFFKKEIKSRKKFNYPPFGKIIKLNFSSKERKEAELESFKLRKELENKFKNIDILDSDSKKVKQMYATEIICKSHKEYPRELLDYLKNITSGWSIDVDPESLL